MTNTFCFISEMFEPNTVQVKFCKFSLPPIRFPMNNVNYETTYLYYISNSTWCNYGNIELHILITFRIL